jgi:hypothetical protein
MGASRAGVLIARGLGEKRFLPKLGGAKPACLGTIEVTDAALTTLDTRAAYAEFDTASASQEIAPLLEAAKPLVLNTQLGKRAEAAYTASHFPAGSSRLTRFVSFSAPGFRRNVSEPSAGVWTSSAIR